MKLWKQFLTPLCRGHTSCAGCDMRVEFTGKPAGNASEELIRKTVGDCPSISLHRLEDLIADALYQEGLQKGAWAVDIGVWGPALLKKEAIRLLEEVRPEFASLVAEEADASARRSLA